MPPNQPSPQWGQQRRLLLGLFHGVPTTKKSIFDLPTGPDYIVLYQKNIEAVCSSEAGVREQIRLTVIHELGHYFGGVKNKFAKILTQHCLARLSPRWGSRNSPEVAFTRAECHGQAANRWQVAWHRFCVTCRFHQPPTEPSLAKGQCNPCSPLLLP